MKILDVIIEDAEAGTTMAGNIASVAFPLFGKEKMTCPYHFKKCDFPKGILLQKSNILNS